MHLPRSSGQGLAETLARHCHAYMMLHIGSNSAGSMLFPSSLNGVRYDLEHAT